MTVATWTADDSKAALAEGWDIFWCADPEDPWEIQRLDFPDDDERVDYDEPQFSDDTEVWQHLAGQARNGSPLHKKALDFIAEQNPTEWLAIRAWLMENG